jgi:hypothetical protein
LKSEAHRQGDPVGIPIAGDDKRALDVAAQLVRDAGFEPVVVGPLSRAKAFDVGTPVYTQVLTAKELRAKLGIRLRRPRIEAWVIVMQALAFTPVWSGWSPVGRGSERACSPLWPVRPVHASRCGLRDVTRAGGQRSPRSSGA